MGIKIQKCTGTANTTTCTKRKPKYLVIHYTASTNSKSGRAMSIAKYFGKVTTKASADFIIDDENIVQYNPDPTTRYCWAVGGTKYKNVTTTEGGRLYGIAKNSNCISIELCSSKKSTKTLNASDTDWYFTDAVLKNGIELSKYLMDLYNIPVDNVIIHHTVTGKICPSPFCVNQNALSKWKDFKSKLVGSSTTTITKPTTATTTSTATTTTNKTVNYIVHILVDNLNIRNNPGTTGTKIVGSCDKNARYTIVEEKVVSGTTWGKLKSGAGWICLATKYVRKM